MTPFRRIAGLLAVVAMIYATGFAVVAHAAGLPMMMPAGTAAVSHDHGGMDHVQMNHDVMNHDAMDHGAVTHDLASHDMSGADQPTPPCDTGCMLCKDCALCLFTGLPAMTLPSVVLQYTAYRPLVAALRGGIQPDLPAEPPRA